MPAMICLLRGVNVGGHNLVKMEVLRALLASLKLKSVETYVQSGNAVFLSEERNIPALAKKIQDALERKCGFRPDVALRTAPELKKVIAKNPFEGREGIEPGKLLVCFLSGEASKTAKQDLAKVDPRGEEVHFGGRELYIYYKNGMGKTKLSAASLDQAMNCSSTGRNWNTVRKLLEMAETLERRE